MRTERNLNFTSSTATPTELNDNAKRHYAVRCCELWCPSESGEPYHDFVTQGRHNWGSYSSCADQAHALLWMLGCTTRSFMNRADAEAGLTWAQGVNISKLVSGARALGCWKSYKKADTSHGALETIPGPGDILLMGDFSKGELEHVAIVDKYEFQVDDEAPQELADSMFPQIPTRLWLHTFDYGQFANGKKCSLQVRREWKDGRLHSPSGKSRAIIGWVDITKVPLDRYAVDLAQFKP